MSQSGILNVIENNPQIPTSFVTDAGTAQPIANTLEVLGGTGITTSGATNVVTISLSGTGSVQTLTGNSGGPISPTAGNINTLGTGSITIVGSGSTLTSQLTGLTIHNVLIGAGTATITKVAPSATSGVPLISQGAASDPVFGTAVVAGGGTGDTSFTAYAVITGGTTATGPLQSIASVGTAGQILTSNGAGALPTFQTGAGATITITGDSGGPLTSGSFTFTGGSTGLTFSGAGTTETLTGTLVVANGGTGRATLTNHGVLVGAGTSAITQLAAGSAGQVLQSGGAAADPAYSTATYPSTATGTGTILRADGTNWSATTTTYPNTNAINTIMYASSANVLGSIAASANGVLISSATNVPSWLAAGTTG